MMKFPFVKNIFFNVKVKVILVCIFLTALKDSLVNFLETSGSLKGAFVRFYDVKLDLVFITNTVLAYFHTQTSVL